MSRCECCQQESVVLVPVLNRDPTSTLEHDLVCPGCAEVIEQAYPSLWNMPLFTSRHKRWQLARAEVVFAVA